MTPDDKVRKADDLLYEILHHFRPFRYLNPVNHAEEREQFLAKVEKGRTYNPTFEYNPLPESISAWKRTLRGIDLGVSDFEEMVDDTRSEWLRFLEMTEQRGTPGITAHSLGVFGAPSPELVQKAQDTLRETPVGEEDTDEVGVKSLHAKLRDRLRQDRIEGWDVMEDPANVHLAHVDWCEKKIRVQAGLLVTRSMVERLVRHEIEIHVYRAANGDRQPLKLFGIGLDGHLTTDEGLAVLLEERLGLITPTIRRRYAGRVLASHWAQTRSFFDTFTSLMESFSVEEAYSLTLRSKRGLRDTSQPGGLLQDHIYLQGYENVRFLPDSDLRMLFVGKVSPHHIPLVRAMIAERRLLEPVFVPEAFGAA